MKANVNSVHEIARERGRCYRCQRQATLYAQETAAGFKGFWFCDACKAAAFGGNSFVKLTDEQKQSLPRLPARREPCWVCGSEAVLETHHLAPRAQFGDEADFWPIVRVCDGCHRRWEERMGTHPWRDGK